MEGWKIKKGIYIEEMIVSEEKILQKFENIRKVSKKTLYKYFFLIALVELINDFGIEIEFDKLMRNCIRKYWNNIYVFSNNPIKLSSKRDTRLEKLFMEEVDEIDVIGRNLDELPRKIKNKIFSEGSLIFSKYVIGAVYGDFNEEIYTFDIKEKYIKMNPYYSIVIIKNKKYIKKILNEGLKEKIEILNEKELVEI